MIGNTDIILYGNTDKMVDIYEKTKLYPMLLSQFPHQIIQNC